MKRPLAVTAMFLVSFLAECDGSAGPADGSRSSFPSTSSASGTSMPRESGWSATIIGPGIRQYDSPEAARMAFQKLTTAMETCRHDTDTDGSKPAAGPV